MIGFKKLLSDLAKMEKDLSKRDSSLVDCVKMERIFSHIEDRTISKYPKGHDDLACLLFTNKYLLSINKHLKIKFSKNLFGSKKYYTINGAQYILPVGIPLIHISGSASRDHVYDFKVDALEKRDIVRKFLREKGVSGAIRESFLVFLDEELGVCSDIEKLFSEDSCHEVQEQLFQQSVAFHAINNNLNLVDQVLAERKKYRESHSL